MSIEQAEVLGQLDAYALGEGWPGEEREKRACKKLARAGYLEVVPGGEPNRPQYRITAAGREFVRTAAQIPTA